MRQYDRVALAEVAAVRRIPPPPGDEAHLASIWRQTQRGTEMGEASTRLVYTDVRRAQAAFDAGVRMITAANRRLATYGLTTCAEESRSANDEPAGAPNTVETGQA
jgi:hypothetical protein